MTEGLIVGIISAIVSLIGIFMSSKNTRDRLTQTLEINQQIMNTELIRVKEDLKDLKDNMRSHNSYAKLFNENIPVIKEKIAVSNRRIEALEKKIG